MNALVTGAGGFLGRYLVERLVERGDRVRGLARGVYPELETLGVEMIQGDVRDAETVQGACADIDVVFHTAAVAGIWGKWHHFYRINTIGTRHVVDACQSQGVPRLVFSSSPSVTFDGTDQCGVDESAPYPDKWLCHYPHTKALAEQHVLASHGKHGVATCALRPHLIWGPRDRHLIPRVIERARRKQLRRVGDGQNLIDMVFVENAVQAHLQAADALAIRSPVGGRAYFISQGVPVNCWDWINEILAIAGLEPATKSISFRVCLACRPRVGAGSPCTANSVRAAHDTLSSGTVGNISLFRHLRRSTRFRISATHFHGPGDAAVGGRPGR